MPNGIAQSSLARRLRRMAAALGLGPDWYLMPVAAFVGLIMGAVATAFIWPLNWIEHEVAGGSLVKPALLIFVLPCLGAFLGAAATLWRSKLELKPGVALIMYAIHRKRGDVPLSVAVRKWIAATLTIGSGGSAGAEGPIVTIGSSIGSAIARRLHTGAQQRMTLLGCGAAAGIASVFNAPIAGIFFVMEILLRDFSLRTFTPIVVAAVISAVWTQALVGDHPLFPPPTEFKQAVFSAIETPTYLLLGLMAGAAGALFIKLLYATEDGFKRLVSKPVLRPALGGVLLGLLGLGWVWLRHDGTGTPEFFGNGYHVITNLLKPSAYGTDNEALMRVAGVLLLLAAVKMIATCLTVGSGGAGGLFAPSLLLGAALGGGFGAMAHAVGMLPTSTPAHAAVVGMAAMLAAVMHAPLTAMLIVYEVTRSYEIMLPLMLATVVSTITARFITPHSVYTARLSRMGIRIGSMSDHTILRRMTVQDVPWTEALEVRQNEQASRLLELSERFPGRDFVVVDDDHRYVGMVTSNDLTAALVYREAIPLLQVGEVARGDLPTLTAMHTLDVAMDRFARHEAQSLAVLDEHGRIAGVLSRVRLMGHYQRALSRD